jgi:phospho-N-acetylmuramoyl-pentapeptide-transferase
VSYALFWGCVAAALATGLGFPLVSWLRQQKLGKAISADGPETHFAKEGTPTMGGLLIFGVALAVALIAAVPKDSEALLPIGVGIATMLIGLYDDLGTLVDRAQRAAHDRTGMILKLVGFIVIGAVVTWLLYDRLDAPRLLVPHYGSYDIGLWHVPIAIAVIVATTAAVGVSDGLDMLEGSTNAVAFGAFGVLALMQDQVAIATFCFIVVGALLGFLWHNAYPARVFMGDVGSLPLGATLGVVALQTGWWLLLPLIGIVFVAEMLSDIIQIGYYRMSGGKRVFRMAPLHHHFEKLGLPETWITVRFLMVGIVGALLALALASLD